MATVQQAKKAATLGAKLGKGTLDVLDRHTLVVKNSRHSKKPGWEDGHEFFFDSGVEYLDAIGRKGNGSGARWLRGQCNVPECKAEVLLRLSAVEDAVNQGLRSVADA